MASQHAQDLCTSYLASHSCFTVCATRNVAHEPSATHIRQAVIPADAVSQPPTITHRPPSHPPVRTATQACTGHTIRAISRQSHGTCVQHHTYTTLAKALGAHSSPNTHSVARRHSMHGLHGVRAKRKCYLCVFDDLCMHKMTLNVCVCTAGDGGCIDAL
jgi:hypothetical protein